MSYTNRNQEDFVKPDQWFSGSNDKPIKKWKKPSADVPPVSPCRPEGRHFQEPTTKRWQMPKAAPESPRQPIRRLHEDWLGSPSTSTTTSSSSSSSFLCSSSHSVTTHNSPPQQIKIQGAGSIKENPFFKNFGGL